MSYAHKQTVSVTTIADGSATAYSEVVTGQVVNVIYRKTDFDNGVDFTITTEDTLQNLWVDTNVNASETVSPMQPTHASDGSASLYAAAGEPVERPIYAVNERIKIVIAQGGNVKSGTFVIILA